MATKKKGLTGKQKAANFLIFLGPERSAQVFKHMTEEEIEQLTLEIANVRKVPTEKMDDIYKEFYEMCLATQYIGQGGINYAKEVLEMAYGSEKTTEIISRISASLQVRPFDFMRQTEPSQLLNFIQSEHPQTIALVLAYIEPEKSSVILSALPPERQAEVAKRIAMMDTTSPEIIKEVERVLERKISSIEPQELTDAGGVKSVVEIINRVDRSTEKIIMESLEVQDPELAEEIKKLMFVFEDIVMIDNRSIQRVLREVETSDLALALKGASSEVTEKIYVNMSSRASEMLKEDIEFMGPVRLKDVEEAQQRIVNIIRRLEEAGEVVIARGGGDEVIV
ncbi:Flagellar motor switch protein FliG [Candidatus Syntrophocurvum alkaliphilum]|uniref:Flagellar motor switch protein FliG n=1 Tax=Candidatus Syntrophocurvum alkaliphilum TaxID=2293317 RepID=A0A6I6DCS1_9FIRM|nr:flagellar motor switch protein FliG [Candidatus Syntrophocurvum alkaliphilum]QGT99164.1 Flagellar motor switch protein FliG [Candidatus Syntrophocurvum alkaliphilum]